MSIDSESLQSNRMSKYTPTQVIATFSSKGEIRPLYVKIEGLDEPVKIEKTQTWTPARWLMRDFLFFKCLYIDKIRNQYMEICLQYQIQNHTWNIVRNDI